MTATMTTPTMCSTPASPSGQKSYLKSPYWWAGIVLMTLGECGNFLAYGFAPASIVSPLGVVAIISNCIIAPLVMKEQFRWRDFYGVVTAVAGAVTIVVSAKENNPKLGPHEIWALIGTWEFETYLGITVLLITVLMLASSKYGGKSIFIYLGLVGLFGGYTALSTKGVASLLSYTLLQTLTFPVTYLLLAILVFTAVMQIKYVNRALQRFEATQVIPTQFVLFTLSVILGSAVLYRDFERYPGDDAGKFIGGCALTFVGVWLITSGRPGAARRGRRLRRGRRGHHPARGGLPHGRQRWLARSPRSARPRPRSSTTAAPRRPWFTARPRSPPASSRTTGTRPPPRSATRSLASRPTRPLPSTTTPGTTASQCRSPPHHQHRRHGRAPPSTASSPRSPR